MWMFAVMSVQLWIWGAVFNKYTALWMTIVYIICLANEGLQLIGYSPGTFDVNDLLFMVVGGLLPIMIELTLQKSVRWKESKTNISTAIRCVVLVVGNSQLAADWTDRRL